MILESGCYLTYADSSGGTLCETPVQGALAYFKPKKDVPKWKFKTNGGKSEIIRGCCMGIGVKKHYQGWAQFAKVGSQFDAEFHVLSDTVGVYVHFGDKPIVRAEVGKTVDLSKATAVVAVNGVNADFGEFVMDLNSFVAKGNLVGYGLLCSQKVI